MLFDNNDEVCINIDIIEAHIGSFPITHIFYQIVHKTLFNIM